MRCEVRPTANSLVSNVNAGENFVWNVPAVPGHLLKVEVRVVRHGSQQPLVSEGGEVWAVLLHHIQPPSQWVGEERFVKQLQRGKAGREACSPVRLFTISAHPPSVSRREASLLSHISGSQAQPQLFNHLHSIGHHINIYKQNTDIYINPFVTKINAKIKDDEAAVSTFF